MYFFAFCVFYDREAKRRTGSSMCTKQNKEINGPCEIKLKPTMLLWSSTNRAICLRLFHAHASNYINEVGDIMKSGNTDRNLCNTQCQNLCGAPNANTQINKHLLPV